MTVECRTFGQGEMPRVASVCLTRGCPMGLATLFDKSVEPGHAYLPSYGKEDEAGWKRIIFGALIHDLTFHENLGRVAVLGFYGDVKEMRIINRLARSVWEKRLW